MPGARRTYKLGPDTCVVSGAVAGGQLVEADTAANSSKVKVAAAASTTVLGVALSDAAPVAAPGDPLLISADQPEVAVAYAPAEVYVKFAATTLYGALVKAAAAGEVTPFVSGTDAPALIVGRCVQPGGVTVSGSSVEGRLRLGHC